MMGLLAVGGVDGADIGGAAATVVAAAPVVTVVLLSLLYIVAAVRTTAGVRAARFPAVSGGLRSMTSACDVPRFGHGVSGWKSQLELINL